MNPNGRPTVLDQTKKEIVYALLRVGASHRSAAAVIGVSEATIRYALAHDPEVAQRVAQSEAMLEVELLVKLRENAGRSWRACTYALEHLVPQRFADPKKAHEIAGQTQRDLAEMEAAAKAEEHQIAAGKLREEPPKPDENDPIEVATRRFSGQISQFLAERREAELELSDRQRERFLGERKKAQASLARAKGACESSFGDSDGEPNRHAPKPLPR